MSETEKVVHIGDQMPRVGSVSHRGAYEVVVSWVSGPRERNADIVDLAPVILTHKFYRPLRDNPEMLKTVHVIEDGAAIAWGEDEAIDMAATTIERLAEETMDSADFRAWLERHKLTLDAASAQLGISRRLVAYYASKRNVPRYIALACRYLDSELSPKSTDIGTSTGLFESAGLSGLLGLTGQLGKGASSGPIEENTIREIVLAAIINRASAGQAFAQHVDEEREQLLRRITQFLQTTRGTAHETTPVPRPEREPRPHRS